ncbi:hypothetical protein Q6D67_09830 [Haliea sp. E1-2-M8]|uniref:transketolase-like TK C-terminal-containing protein n=1 Tax=Haliea sp. E1-2-M8 TaxID=3064706 RepID=UPI0027191D83|nr:hypothetical protein [Haliea sp. E1-2-M8]MDO8862002.1 hypothetical protein [Haliea sp. E1-2-M8]
MLDTSGRKVWGIFGAGEMDEPESLSALTLAACYYSHSIDEAHARVRLLGSGAIMLEVIAAGELLANEWAIESDVWSVTSFTELAREARELERWNRLHPTHEQRKSHVAECLKGDIPVVAATDYVRAVPQLIASYIRPHYTVLGTDGFGRSDTRSQLRNFFEVDRYHIVTATLASLARASVISSDLCMEAIEKYGIETERASSWNT